MKILYGQNLVNALHELMLTSKYRIWIAVPYIGGLTSIKKILGSKWYDDQNIALRVITDVSNTAAIDSQSLTMFYQRGEVKSLIGLHAKIYIIDQKCLITSANLTNTAFTRRHEVGFIVEQAQEAIQLFENLWIQSEDIKLEKIKTIKKSTKKSAEEENAPGLKQLWQLPQDEVVTIKEKNNQFINYYRIVADFRNFADKYAKFHRLWENDPIFFEIDGLFNYLYHHATGFPSKKYKEKSVSYRNLTEVQQIQEIKKWALEYKKWNKLEKGGNDISHRLEYSQKLKQYLSNEKILNLNENEVKQLLLCTNSMREDQRNIPQIFRKNDFESIKQALNYLVHSDATLPARMAECKKIKNLGTSTINEIIGLMEPDEYPIVNNNSISGMKFFGYDIK